MNVTSDLRARSVAAGLRSYADEVEHGAPAPYVLGISVFGNDALEQVRLFLASAGTEFEVVCDKYFDKVSRKFGELTVSLTVPAGTLSTPRYELVEVQSAPSVGDVLHLLFGGVQ